MNIYQRFVATVEKHAEKTMISEKDSHLTYLQMSRLADAISLKLGDRRGKNIGVLAGNCLEFPAAVLGIYKSGAAFCPFNAMLNANELVPQIIHSEVEVLFIGKVFEPYLPSFKQISSVSEIHVLEDFSPLSPDESSEDYSTDDAESLAVIMYTSGTTGNPKGVMLSHRNIVENFQQFNTVLDFQPQETFLTALPFFHSFSFTTNLISSIFLGMEIILNTPFNPKTAVRIIEERDNIVMTAVAPMFSAIAQYAAMKGGLDLSAKLRVAVSGGGPLPDAIYQAFKRHVNVEILQGYGLTEAAPVVSVNPGPGKQNRVGTIGPAMPGIEIEIKDDNGNPVAIGEEGELCVRGKNVMQGYFKNEKATAETFHEGGWLRTGDLGVIDHSGYIRVVGRSKELIISSGENIHPQEIEAAIIKHPKIGLVGVVGKADKLKQEVPMAFVEPAEGIEPEEIDTNEIKSFLKEELAHYKIPHYWKIMEEMPRLFGTKVNKKVLAEIARQQ